MSLNFSGLFRLVFSLFVLFAAAAPVHAAEGESNHIKARLIAESATVKPGGDIRIGLEYTAAPGWHTYWINPGDAGLATRINWSLPDHVAASALQWPVPEILPTLGLTSYGYDGRNVLLTTLHNESRLAAGDTFPVRATVNFLVCADVCIPESLEVSLNLKVGDGTRGPDAKLIDETLKTVPTTPLTGTINLAGDTAELGFPVDAPGQDAYFFAAQEGVLAAGAPQALDSGARGFTLRVKAAGTTLPEGDLSGVLKLADGRAFAVTLSRAPLAADLHGLGAAPVAKSDTSLSGVLIAMLFAFTGGLILNLMPCVFPVLSMKLLSLARSGHDQGLARTEALSYGAGTILTFVILALILTVARVLGQSIGWGFQLQSPYVTAGLSLVILLVALNMSGVFEIGSSLQAVGGLQVGANRPRLGAFLTGVLAVVVAAPCTAPFMATAIGVALAQGGFVSFAIFLALGIGFALPFVALTFLITLVPGFARALPRPGKWMDILKHALSLLMYAACLWLVWVFAQQVQLGGIILLVLALALVTLAVMKIRLPKFVKPVVLAGGVILCGLAASLPRTDTASVVPSGLAAHTPFGFDKLAELRSRNKPVFVDLTAAWCVTCKVNERLVLSRPEFTTAMADTGTVYMVGDWTNQDAEIARYLTQFGRSGVPLYVYYGPNNAEPVVLPQMLKTAEVVKLVRR